jgi:hypothetical protein
MRGSVRYIVFTCCILLGCACPAAAQEWRFELQCDSRFIGNTYTGRVYVFFSRVQEPRTGPGWFFPEPFISRDVENWNGEAISLELDDPRVFTYPNVVEPAALAGLRAQSVVRLNPWSPDIGTGAGNGFSRAIELPAEPGTVTLAVDQIVPEESDFENDWYQVLRVPSPMLSQFHGRDVSVVGGVYLPASYYDQPERRYPVMFSIPGFGGDHRIGHVTGPIEEDNREGVEFIRVYLSAKCATGHHVFADSATNGPVGESLIREFLPALDAAYRTIAEPRARFLTGHSSGGWSSLWLQVTYPDHFNGVWSTSPDPVDFRDFQRINLYRAGENMFVDSNGERRPLARQGGRVLIWYQDFSDMEHVLGYGGQLHSFEAVFSPLDENGQPRLLWDRETGEIDTQVAQTWEAYDIRLILERNWDDLAPRLAGKLHVFMGDADTFYLEGATILLKQSLEQLGSDAVVEIFPGLDHGTIMTPELRNRMRSEMVDRFLESE